MSNTRSFIIVETSSPIGTQNDLLTPLNYNKRPFLDKVSSYFRGLAGGARPSQTISYGSVSQSANSVAASKNGTFTGLPAASDTISIGGQAITFINTRAFLVVQDLTYTADTGGTAGNSITIAYTAGGTAGAEVVTVVGSAISVQIEDTVSTATQIQTAVNASAAALALISVAVSGTGSSTQTTASATHLANGAAVAANQVARDTVALTATLIAAATVSAINSSTNANLVGSVVAFNTSAGVITITALMPGVSGNLISLADSAANFTWAGAATALSGGTGSFPSLKTVSV